MQNNQHDEGGIVPAVAAMLVSVAVLYMTYDFVTGVMQGLPMHLPWIRLFS